MRWVFTLAIAGTSSLSSLALEPADVWLVVNKNVPESRRVADYYMAKRHVPKENVIELDLPKGEDISRSDYDVKMVGPVREALKNHKDKVTVLLTTYGVPLRVGAQPSSDEEKKELDKIRPDLEAARKKVSEFEKNKEAATQLFVARKEVEKLQNREGALTHRESHASVDSELMLLWWPKYPLERWVLNPLYFQHSDDYRKGKPPVVLTCRLDGPNLDIVKRLVDDSVEVEARGLAGEVVIDARGIPFNPKDGRDSGHGYGGYDESMREAARLMEKVGMKVTLDNKAEVLPPGSAKGVAIYCGWYSHGNFVDCCDYVPGAVAWHLASSEAVTLRNNDSKVWCPNLLKKGVAATLGPVAEPYTVGFPKPAEFFGFLATGKYTLVESYGRSILFCSWMTVLVGDPLYNPFQKIAKLKVEDVVPSPKGGKWFEP
jgi:uncharacterized protein (TIGR03790 family)